MNTGEGPFFFKGGRNEIGEPFKCNIKGFVSQVKYTSSNQGTLLVNYSLHFLFIADWSHTQWALLLLQLICIQVQHVHIQRCFSEYVGCNNCLSYCCLPVSADQPGYSPLASTNPGDEYEGISQQVIQSSCSAYQNSGPQGGWCLSQLTCTERQVTSWTSRQSVTRQTYRDRHSLD